MTADSAKTSDEEEPTSLQSRRTRHLTRSSTKQGELEISPKTPPREYYHLALDQAGHAGQYFHGCQEDMGQCRPDRRAADQRALQDPKAGRLSIIFLRRTGQTDQTCTNIQDTSIPLGLLGFQDAFVNKFKMLKDIIVLCFVVDLVISNSVPFRK